MGINLFRIENRNNQLHCQGAGQTQSTLDVFDCGYFLIFLFPLTGLAGWLRGPDYDVRLVRLSNYLITGPHVDKDKQMMPFTELANSAAYKGNG